MYTGDVVDFKKPQIFMTGYKYWPPKVKEVLSRRDYTYAIKINGHVYYGAWSQKDLERVGHEKYLEKN